ncbi:MAG: DMT family transporter [Pseudomonadota bacterium]
MTQEQIGKLFRIGGAAATVGVAACVHAAAKELPLAQIMAVRAGISGVIILAWGLVRAPASLLPNRWGPHVVRGGLALVAMWLTYFAFARLDIAQAQTLTYIAPLLVLPIAMVRLGEAPSPRIILGLAMGFAGVLLILGLSTQAGPAAVWGALAGIAGAVLIAIIQITVRQMTATETTLSIAMSFTLIVAVVASLSALRGDWVWPTGPLVWVLLASGVFGAMNLLMFAESLARAPASAVAPLDYTGLIWALLVDWIIFAHAPGVWSIGGSALITLAALIVVLAPRAPAPPRAPSA